MVQNLPVYDIIDKENTEKHTGQTIRRRFLQRIGVRQTNTVSPPRAVAALLDIFASAGAEAYIVGGAVRDSLAGRRVHDWDVASPLPPEAMGELFRGHGYRVIPTGIKHGTVTVISDGMPVEITAFRIDGAYTNGRHPDRVEFTTRIEDDLARRDFTVNAMAYSPRSGICDPFGGRADLAAGVIRCVGDARTRFTEDALRILRAFRFAAQLGYTIEDGTLGAAAALASRLELISAERIAAETEKLLLAPEPSGYLAAAESCGVLAYVFPGITFDASDLAPVDRLAADAPLRMGAMLRRTGLADSERAAAVLRGLRLSNADRRRAYAAAAQTLPPAEPYAVRRFLRETADPDAAIAAAAARGESGAAEVAEIARQTAAEGGPVTLRTLAVDGAKLRAAGYPTGRQMGKLISALLEAVTADPSLNTEEALLALAAKLTDEQKTERNDI